ncbi:hypothetical protein Pmani_027234 [Petrolisthes manimaculis]|uniref:Uncharacterized protein n=1 Tax=Petrolisthes manimaculis TaxID=1843537 RepID=A0AAE1P327_9EUCA|nr:hypothetical protein Pmani_027234 [Petrolisthes manimaculis]
MSADIVTYRQTNKRPRPVLHDLGDGRVWAWTGALPGSCVSRSRQPTVSTRPGWLDWTTAHCHDHSYLRGVAEVTPSTLHCRCVSPPPPLPLHQMDNTTLHY